MSKIVILNVVLFFVRRLLGSEFFEDVLSQVRLLEKMAGSPASKRNDVIAFARSAFPSMPEGYVRLALEMAVLVVDPPWRK
jgi:hypothetical protein